MSTRHSITQDIILHETVMKRKVVLDQLAQGLECLGVLQLIRLFPEVFEPMFVARHDLDCESVLGVITTKPREELSDKEKTAWEHLQQFIKECSCEGMCVRVKQEHKEPGKTWTLGNTYVLQNKT